MLTFLFGSNTKPLGGGRLPVGPQLIGRPSGVADKDIRPLGATTFGGTISEGGTPRDESGTSISGSFGVVGITFFADDPNEGPDEPEKLPVVCPELPGVTGLTGGFVGTSAGGCLTGG